MKPLFRALVALRLRPQNPAAARRLRFRLPIATVLVGGFAFLVLAAVASVLALGLTSGSRNTIDLLRGEADLAMDTLLVRVRHQLDPAEEQAEFLAGLIARGDLDITRSRPLRDALRASLAAVPQVSAIQFTSPTLDVVRVTRLDGELASFSRRVVDSPQLRTDVEDARDHYRAYWAAPVWSDELWRTVLSLRMPVRRNGVFVGVIGVAVTVDDLSRFLGQFFHERNVAAYVLYDDTHVLAQAGMLTGKLDFSMRLAEPPLPRLDEMNDPILAEIWNGRSINLGDGQTEARLVRLHDTEHLILLRRLSGYGTQLWTLAISLPYNQYGMEVQRLFNTALAGGGILLVSVAGAFFIGRTISRRIGRLAETAETVRRLDFRGTTLLPDSRFRELANAASAFNDMVTGLRWFEAYVPKALVMRLMRRSNSTALISEQRLVTVLFTDIRGFSTMAEHMAAEEIAALLNDHFALVSACIEAEEGTVDKFIGDGVMAFWGAPDEQEDHAARALRAAKAIAEALSADNGQRMARRQSVVRVRMGLHSGPVVVGNIGSASRLNYTIVGDTVNIAARIEELARTRQGDEDTLILCSDATAQFAGDAVPWVCCGDFTLRGRSGEITICQVVPVPLATPDPVPGIRPGAPDGGGPSDGAVAGSL
ncbi:MAG: adenylate/guanylate cyclase domain-containing protein [Azospirillaceae bacterium]|nr:adenylate/guanylate cyclase domain-containing protein [Azospirillaceae bacterium]